MTDIIRGRMSAADHAEIERLALSMKNPTAGKIAQKVRRHVATVNWYLVSRGLAKRPLRVRNAPYRRGNTIVHPYLSEHDTFLVEMSLAGRTYGEIAEAVTQKFGIRRSVHSVRIRLIMLASQPD